MRAIKALLLSSAALAATNEGNAGNGVTLKVPSDVAGFEAGRVLNTVEDIAAYWRAAYAEANDGENIEHLDDETVVSLASDVQPAMKGEDYHDADEYMLEVLTALENGGDATDTAEIAEDIRAVAIKVSQSKVINGWVNDVIEGQRTVDVGPAYIGKELLAILQPEELAVISWPGSETGNNPDITKGTRIVAGESKKYTHSKVKDFISLQPRVKELSDMVAKISTRAEGQKESQADKTAKKNVNRLISSANAAYIYAIKAALLFAHLKDHPHITIEWVEDDGDIAKWKYCIDVGNRHKPKEYGTFTVAGITKLAPSQIPGTMSYASLVEALKRKKKGTPATTKYPMPEGVKDLDDMLSTIVHALETPSLWSQLSVALATRLDADKKNEDAASVADGLISNLDRLSDLSSDAIKRHMTRLRQIQMEKAKAGGVPEKDGANQAA